MIDLNSKILITWASWFVWSNLVHTLVELWARNIHVILREFSDTWRLNSIIDKLHISYVSLLDAESLGVYINTITPDIIYHLAASWANIWRNKYSTKDIFDANIIGTLNLINSCKSVWFSYFINTWSSSEYWVKDSPMKESDLLQPNNEYWISKASATMYATFLGKKEQLPIYTFRLFSVYGYYEDKNRLMPTLILNYLHWISPNLSSPNSVRDYIFIEDVITCYLNIDSLRWDFWWIYNIWSGVQYKVSDIVWIIKNNISSDVLPNYWIEHMKQIEPKTWVSDNSKMIFAFWSRLHNIDSWIIKTIHWFQEYLHLYD